MSVWIEGYQIDEDGAIDATAQNFAASEIIRYGRATDDEEREFRVTLRDGAVFAIDTREFVKFLGAKQFATTPATDGFYLIDLHRESNGLPNYSLAPVIAWRHDGQNAPVAVAVGCELDGLLQNDVLTPAGEVFDISEGRHVPFAEWFARETRFMRDPSWIDKAQTVFDVKPDSPDDPVELRLPLKAQDRLDHDDFEATVLQGLARLQMRGE